MRYIFIINNTAGNGKYQSEVLGDAIKSASDKLGLSSCCSVYYTKHRGDAFDYISSLTIDDGPYTVYACGGDGTLREVVNAVKKSDADISVGIVPCGTGNDFAKAFTSSEKFLDIEAQLTGKTEYIDLLKIDDEYCVNLANVGFDANVAEKMIEYKKRFGSLSYKLALVRELFSSMKYRMRAEFDDGDKIDGNFLLFSIANGIAYGGGFYAAILSKMTDGMIDVCYCDYVSRLTFISSVGNYKKGKHLDGRYSYVHRKPCKSFKMYFDTPTSFCEDGEIFMKTEVNISVESKALKLVIPSECEFVNK